MGLILNESVTNAIKYAFGCKGGQIVVSLQMIRPEILLLTMADNVSGFPPFMDFQQTNTLGLEMMKALCRQLGGEFSIESIDGVRISIEFPFEPILSGFSKV